jgi:hypothetical protein
MSDTELDRTDVSEWEGSGEIGGGERGGGETGGAVGDKAWRLGEQLRQLHRQEQLHDRQVGNKHSLYPAF